MTTESFQAYGVKETTSVASELDRNLEEIAVNGFTIVEDVLDASQLGEAARRIDAVYEAQAAEVGGADNLRRINDEMIARCMLAYDEFFLGLATNAKIVAVLERLLGDYFTLLQQNAITNEPGRYNYQTSWHRDLIYQHFVPSRPIAVSALVCIDDFSETTGGTCVLPGSHKVERFPSKDFVQKHERVAAAKAGSAIVFDSMLFHRGGVNRSRGPRRGLNHLYGLPFIKQQINLPRMLGGKYSDDKFLSRFLGYESEPASDVREWRLKRLGQAEGADA
jgi:ectoine hydroxylase-related dioxygenase (phytanoyl-CoA dioxygenase family)